MDESHNIIFETYGELVKCEEDHPCCDTAEEVVINWYKQITALYTKIHSSEREIAILQTKVDEIENECPHVTGEEPEEPDRSDNIGISAEVAFGLADLDKDNFVRRDEFAYMYQMLNLENGNGESEM